MDLISRVLAEKLGDQFKNGIYVENRPGANWIIGMDAVAKSAADGNTLLLVSTSGFSINPHLFKNVPPMDNFVPITTATKGSFVLLVNPKLGVTRVADFINLLKASPGKYNHASNSATTKLLSEFFKSQAGVEYADVSYRGASLAISDTMIGVTDFCFVDFGSATNVLQDRSLIPLAVTSAERYELSPDIPTLSEAALPGFSVDGGTVLFAPAKISPEILAHLNATFMNVLRSPDVIARFRTIGQIAKGSGSDETLKNLQTEVDRWAKLIKEKNITLE
ncbi:MAG: Bug family tripartite tricarboxylate transporter substrate binding protein [Beijerinckiaceae bacterium]